MIIRAEHVQYAGHHSLQPSTIWKQHVQLLTAMYPLKCCTHGVICFKLNQRTDVTIVHQVIQIASQSKVKIWGLCRPSSRKVSSDDSAIGKMGSEHLCDAIGYVWRSTIVHEHCCSKTLTFLECWNDGMP